MMKKSEIKEWDRTKKYFAVSREEIELEGYDLSFSRHKEDVFEEVEYEEPTTIINKLIQAEVGEMPVSDLVKIESGIVNELMALRSMIS